MNIKPGTVMIAVPKDAAPEDRCFICTGPKPHPNCKHDHVGEIFVVGMLEGVLAALTTRAHLPHGRVPLCVAHETMLREALAGPAQQHPEILDKLGIEYKVA